MKRDGGVKFQKHRNPAVALKGYLHLRVAREAIHGRIGGAKGEGERDDGWCAVSERGAVSNP